MNSQTVDVILIKVHTDDHNLDSERFKEHIDHTYSSSYLEMENEIPYSALSPNAQMLKKKIRRLHRKAQRQKQKIKSMKKLIKQLRSCS